MLYAPRRNRNWRVGPRYPQRRRPRRELELYRDFLRLQRDLRTASPTASPGRYSGTVKRESDGATFSRLIELGSPSGNKQPIRIYDEVGGGLPGTPQHAGDALRIGSILIFFGATDHVAERKYLGLVLGNLMLNFSQSIYHDGRPDVKLAGILNKK